MKFIKVHNEKTGQVEYTSAEDVFCIAISTYCFCTKEPTWVFGSAEYDTIEATEITYKDRRIFRCKESPEEVMALLEEVTCQT